MLMYQLMKTVCCVLLVSLFWVSPVRAGESFAEWLEDFQAYDVLESELSQDAPSPETLLHRADLLLQSNNPQKALRILDQYGSFPGQALEARRIWTKARAFRAMNRPLEALLTYSRAGGLMTQSDRQQAFAEEPGLTFFWKNTLLKWTFEHCYQGKIQANAGQKQLMLQAAGQAASLWGEDAFWQTLQSALSGQYPPSDSPEGLEVLSIDAPSRTMTIRTLAALAIGDVHFLRNSLEGIAVPELRQLLSALLREILGQDIDPLRSEVLNIQAEYPKYTAALEILIPAIRSLKHNPWQIAHPGLESWETYTNKLHNVPPAKALEIVKNELNSVLLSQTVKEALNQFYFAYAVITERLDLARDIWESLDLNRVPLSLQYCAFVSGFSPLEACFSDQDQNNTKRLLLSSLAAMTGFQPETGLQLPFWVRIKSSRTLKEAQQLYALDMFLTYALKQSRWQDKPSVQLAKEAGLLFPETSLGSRALLYLARQAYDDGRTQIAWAYLQHMNPEILSNQEQLQYFQAKGGLLMDLNRLDESLETYQQLLRRFPQGLSPKKKLKIALLAQRRGDWEWAQKTLEALWEQRGDFDSTLQAEIMFWLGEGAQKFGDELQALKYYLKLAWEFPEEGMWAVTAMYRSALIYEKRGELGTARNLLKKVLKNADRESQKKAAQDRIDAIEDRMRLKTGQDTNEAFLF